MKPLLIRLACVVLVASVTTVFAELPARLQEAERLLREGVSTSDERRRLCA